MRFNILKNTIFCFFLMSVMACNVGNSRLNGEWKNETLGFKIDFNVQNKTMHIRTGVSDISVKTSFDKIEESGDVVTLIKKGGDNTTVTFKNEDEIEVSSNDIPITLSFNRVKK
jgi:5-methylcytosine-specific restriction endonuclease McrBC regulatory subunit McrC